MKFEQNKRLSNNYKIILMHKMKMDFKLFCFIMYTFTNYIKLPKPPTKLLIWLCKLVNE